MKAKNSLLIIVEEFEKRINITFKPDKKFYSNVGINQKRWGQLTRNEKPMFTFEAKNLSTFFNVPLEKIIQ